MDGSPEAREPNQLAQRARWNWKSRKATNRQRYRTRRALRLTEMGCVFGAAELSFGAAPVTASSTPAQQSTRDR